MKKITLIGYPAGHSLSPKLFELGYLSSPNINKSWSYWITEEKNLDKALQIIKEENIHWANITAPFKEKIMRYVSKKDNISSKIGASNLINIDSNGDIISFNTDYYAAKSAIRKSIEILNRERKNIKVYIIGNGGAGKSAEAATKDFGLEYNIYNRTLTNNVKNLEEFENDIIENKLGISIIFYTLPTYTPIVENIKKIEGTFSVIEPNYLSPSLQDSPNYISGIEWLIEQAYEGFYLMTGVRPNKKEMVRIADLTK